ncbi:MAG: IS1380 family transposase [Opitutus sp.]|nr:IS1380 family transposase [Opitutus sp.]
MADFSGGTLSSDGGLPLLRELDARLGLTRTLARCFRDERDQRFVDHTVPQLLAQRLYGLALGYEDLNDHEQLRHDPLLATACAKTDPLGRDRFNPQDRGIPLAAASTLNRLELSNNKETRCHKLPHDPAKVEACLLTLGVRCLPKHTKEIVLDLDSMGHLVHGLQEGRHYNDYYGDYCYLPLYLVVGDVVLWAQLRTSDKSGADGVVPALTKVVAALRQRCKKARIIVRGDSGFCGEEILAWCEAQRKVYYCLGLAKNSVLREKLTPALDRARQRACLCGAPSVREFAEFDYQTQQSWSRARRVVGKAEVTHGGDNPRYVVTNLPAKAWQGDQDRTRFTPARLYEELYCARGEMENVLKQQVLDLEADKLSTHFFASNQLRLWLASLAYLLLERLRAVGCHGTELARATAGSLRLKLLKVAAQVTVSVRRVYLQLSSAYPRQDLFRLCHARLMRLAPADG